MPDKASGVNQGGYIPPEQMFGTQPGDNSLLNGRFFLNDARVMQLLNLARTTLQKGHPVKLAILSKHGNTYTVTFDPRQTLKLEVNKPF